MSFFFNANEELRIHSVCPLSLYIKFQSVPTSICVRYLVSYDDKEMTLSWHQDNPVAVSDKIQIPSYTLTDYKYYSSVDEFTTGMIFR